MIFKIFKAIWFLSVLAVLAVLLLVYASLPEQVVVQEVGSDMVRVSREVLFYIVLGLLALLNVMVYVIGKLFPTDKTFRAWFHGLIISLNIFFIIALNMVNLYNSNEKFDYERIGFIIYGSVILVAGWAISWPLVKLFTRNSSKQTV